MMTLSVDFCVTLCSYNIQLNAPCISMDSAEYIKKQVCLHDKYQNK